MPRFDPSDFDRRYDRDLSREPSYSTRPRPALDARGTVKQRFAPDCSHEEHEAIKADPARWSLLPCVGRMETEDDAGRPMWLVMRNCLCHSTLAVETYEAL
jgi:hypothetical protein